MEVRIKILFTSICHTDLGAWQGKNEAQRVYPRIFGHEASGVVESVGEGVEDMKAGDHVVPIFNGECGDCVFCKSKTSNLCKKFRVDPFKSVMANDGKTRFWTKQGEPIYHFLNTSTFSEYTVIDSACVVKIDPSASLKTMTLLSCGVSTGLGAAWNTADVQAGSSVAVFGLGAVGLAEIREISEGGVDFSFECAGNLDVLREAFLSSHEGWGLTVLLGIHQTPKTLPLHPMELFDGRRIIGSVFGDFKGKSQLPEFAKKCMHGAVKLDDFITHELPFSEINKAFQLLMDGKSLRCILHL
ncbi:Alcohol dehydrogenase GroES-like protein [Cynara cardunculus var. scolymus]|uniref:Alcohol dehydrogenase GroES-like protein n=1 Tax=Cynara cardunculus var. scolymus TaxID=59895 RepID=A0A124SCY0_CYNCS|nr:Alcohol dehydrogenase GroES-like protein [Cynara cardunculus var. scolymus]